jgi:hypothetical protein
MATPRTPLGAATLARDWWHDVNDTKNGGTYENPIWLPVRGLSNFQFSEEPSLQDDSDFDSRGAGSDIKAGYKWSLTYGLQRKVDPADPTIYDAGQEFIRAAAQRKTGLDNVVDVRWYQMNVDDQNEIIGPVGEAHRGYASASFSHQSGAWDELATAEVTLNGRGAYENITHPSEVTAAVPTVLSLTPDTGEEAGGILVVIRGTGFADATKVLFGATEAEFLIVNGTEIHAVAPAKTASTVAVSVQNATGVSTVTKNFVYTTA